MSDTTADAARAEAERLAVQKAQREAATAAAKAEADAIKAGTELARARLGAGTIPAAPVLTAPAPPTSGVGALEASLLAARELDKVAEDIAKLLSALKPAPKGFVIFTGTQRPNFADLALFDLRQGAVDAARARAVPVLQTAMDQAARDHAAGLVGTPPAGPVTPAAPAGPRVSAAPVAGAALAAPVPAVAAASIGNALDLAAKITGYFQTEYATAVTAVAGVDADLLAVTLAGRLGKAWYPARWPVKPRPDPALLNDLWKLAGMVAAERRQADELQALYAQATGALDDTGRTALRDGTTRAMEAVAAQAAVGQALDALVNGLITPDTAGIPSIMRLAEQAQLQELLQLGACALILQVSSTAGTVYNKRSLLASIFGMPTFVAGGAIVGFLVADSEGVVRTSGQIRLHSCFKRLTEVRV